MKILYIAYSCLPNKGSEEKIGWNIPLTSAKTNQVIVVTKEEHRAVIEQYISKHNIDNPKFYFVDIPKIDKAIWKGSAYSVRLNIWHKKALPVVKKICENENVDIIHQITPIEFRSIGKYYKIPNIRFVCGPIGGGEYIPAGLKSYGCSNIHIEFIRWILNSLYRFKYRVTKQLERCNYFLFANRETQCYLKGLTNNIPNQLYFDNGISQEDFVETKKKERKPGDKLVFLVAGRMAYRKGHRFLLDVLKQLPNSTNCEFRFVGSGPALKKLKRICSRYKLDRLVVFTGRIPFSDMAKEYEKADVFVMPSIRETTGAVLLEAAAKSVPVITINRFGGPVLFDKNSAYFYSGYRKSEFVNSLKKAILTCIKHPDELDIIAHSAKNIVQMHTWENKVEKYNSIYKQILEKH